MAVAQLRYKHVVNRVTSRMIFVGYWICKAKNILKKNCLPVFNYQIGHPNLNFDCSATRWMSREISARREEAREFFIRNQDRIVFGSDQVSNNERGFDFLASRFWVHRKLWETAYVGPSPIFDPDFPADKQPQIRGLALPDECLQKLYHDNAIKLLAKIGVSFEGWG